MISQMWDIGADETNFEGESDQRERENSSRATGSLIYVNARCDPTPFLIFFLLHFRFLSRPPFPAIMLRRFNGQKKQEKKEGIKEKYAREKNRQVTSFNNGDAVGRRGSFRKKRIRGK